MCYTINLNYACHHTKPFTKRCSTNRLARLATEPILPLFSNVRVCGRVWESQLAVEFTCFHCSRTGIVGPNAEHFLALHPDFEAISSPLAERFALFWRDIVSPNHGPQLQFRTGDELEAPLTSYHAPPHIIKNGELQWLQSSYRCLALSIQAVVARRAETYSAEEITALEEKYTSYVKPMELLHSMLETVLERRVTYQVQKLHRLNLIEPLSPSPMPRLNLVDLAKFLAGLSPEEISDFLLPRDPESESDNEEEEEQTLWWWIAILRGDVPLLYS